MIFQVFPLLTLLVLSHFASALDFSAHPYARIRHESFSNYDLDKSKSDYRSFVGSRMWLDITLRHEDTELRLLPQSSNVWGEDHSFEIHLGYLKVPLTTELPWTLTLGRQEISYGDELILGKLLWSNVGRSFDAAKVEMPFGSSRLDLFTSKLAETNSQKPSLGDKDLHGLYFSGRNELQTIRESDFYVLNLNDSTTLSRQDVVAYGFRLKGSSSFFDHRSEMTLENINGKTEYQLDSEVGVPVTKDTRFAANYFVASANFNQFFPTAHIWLGIGDVISRRNVEGFQVKYEHRWHEKFNSSLSFHQFFRRSTDQTAFAYRGEKMGSLNSQEERLGEEVDVILNYQAQKHLSYQVGGAYWHSERYLKQSQLPDDSTFFYVQLTLNWPTVELKN